MRQVNIDRLAFLLGELHEARGKLKRLAQISFDELLADEQKLDLIKYNLIIAIQSAIDVCYHIVAKSEARAPQDYADCFLRLAQLGIIEDRFAQSLKEMVRFRNLLVHVYGKVDNKRVYQILRNNLADLDRFEEQIKGFVEGL